MFSLGTNIGAIHDEKFLDMRPLIMTTGFPPHLENRENEKCQAIVREFDFGQNVREMSGSFVSDCNIYGKGPQFYEIIQRILHTPTCILSWVICVQYFYPA